jgi:hypothetical protein
LPQCYAGFEISPTCISERGLDQKKEEYQRKMAEAMSRLGASYKITLRLVNDPVAAGYDVTAADVFTDVVRDQGGRAGRIRNTSCGRAIGFDYSRDLWSLTTFQPLGLYSVMATAVSAVIRPKSFS